MYYVNFLCDFNVRYQSRGVPVTVRKSNPGTLKSQKPDG